MRVISAMAVWTMMVALGPGLAHAQAPTAAAPVSAEAPSDAEIDRLVARIALYPDPLLVLVLQASISPLQVVEAARFFFAGLAALSPSEEVSDIIKDTLIRERRGRLRMRTARSRGDQRLSPRRPARCTIWSRRKRGEPSLDSTKSANSVFLAKGNCLEMRASASAGESPRSCSRAY